MISVFDYCSALFQPVILIFRAFFVRNLAFFCVYCNFHYFFQVFLHFNKSVFFHVEKSVFYISRKDGGSPPY
jgi:hypothetical protein